MCFHGSRKILAIPRHRVENNCWIFRPFRGHACCFSLFIYFSSIDTCVNNNSNWCKKNWCEPVALHFFRRGWYVSTKQRDLNFVERIRIMELINRKYNLIEIGIFASIIVSFELIILLIFFLIIIIRFIGSYVERKIDRVLKSTGN